MNGSDQYGGADVIRGYADDLAAKHAEIHLHGNRDHRALHEAILRENTSHWFPVQTVAVESEPDMVNHPPHYSKHPSGIECITIVEHFNFNIGNAVKYCWRAGLKGDEIEDLKKAEWYIHREIERREHEIRTDSASTDAT